MTTTPSKLACQKQLFSLDEGVHYLNGAYMSPLLKSAEEAGIRGLRRKRTPHLLKSGDFFDESDLARRRFAQLINAPDPRRIAILPSASYGISTAARNVHAQQGQNIVLLHEQFPSNVYPWRPFAKQGVELRTVKPPDGFEKRGQRWNERLLEAIDPQTAVVSVEGVHWADGTRFDLERVGQRARQVGAVFIVDASQSAGAVPFDVQRVRPDALLCAAYKWLLGPYSIGVGYFGPRFDEGEPIEYGWMPRQGSDDFSQLANYQDAYQPGARRYDVGEHGNFTLLPMMIAGLDQLLAWGVEHIQPYCRQLIQPLIQDLRGLGYWVEDEAWRYAHLFGIRPPAGVDFKGLAQTLAARKISVSVRGVSIRISPHLYNDAADIEALLEALKSAV